MINNWKEFKLEELCDIRRGASPRPIKDFICNSGIPWVKIADATSSNSRFIDKTKEFIKQEGKNKSLFVEKGTLILSNSATPGIPKFMNIDACVHDGWLVLKNFNGITKEFMYYILLNERKKLVNKANGSVFNNLKTETVKNHIIKIPVNKEIQDKVVSTLKNIDKKIELNIKINEKLESLAKTIYKHWFVDFGPFKGNEMVESEVGMIPKGWEVQELNELCSPQYGYTESATNENIGPKFLRGTDINKSFIINWNDVPYCQISMEKLPKYKLNFGDIVIIRMADPGKIAIIERDLESVFASYLIRFNHDKIKLGNYYFYYYLTSKNYQNFVLGNSNGTTRMSINAKTILNKKIIVPPIDVINSFEKKVSQIRKLMNNNLLENEKLIETRDYLLPKLLSGEITVE